MNKDGKPNAGHMDDREKSHRQSQHAHNLKDTGGTGHGVKPNPTGATSTGGNADETLLNGGMMTFALIIENLDNIQASMAGNPDDPSAELGDTPIDDTSAPVADTTSSLNEDELLNMLNQIYTPVLVTQDLQGSIQDTVTEAMLEDGINILLENNVIQFGDAARMAQLRMVCAQLIAQQKKCPKFDIWRKSMEIAEQAKLDMQKENFAAAEALAQKFLVKVSTTNNSSTARQAATNLLPTTQH